MVAAGRECGGGGERKAICRTPTASQYTLRSKPSFANNAPAEVQRSHRRRPRRQTAFGAQISRGGNKTDTHNHSQIDTKKRATSWSLVPAEGTGFEVSQTERRAKAKDGGRRPRVWGGGERKDICRTPTASQYTLQSKTSFANNASAEAQRSHRRRPRRQTTFGAQ